MTRIYFDTEFTGLHQRTTLISIGLIDDDEHSFYAEFDDYDVTQVDKWIQGNVIDKLMLSHALSPFTLKSEKSTVVKGDSTHISHRLSEWLRECEKPIEFVSDVCHYDFVLLIDLLCGHALELPSYIAPVCHDINQDLALYFNVDQMQAFNMNREEVLLKAFEVSAEHEAKHNALHDAMVIRQLYRGLHDIEAENV